MSAKAAESIIEISSDEEITIQEKSSTVFAKKRVKTACLDSTVLKDVKQKTKRVNMFDYFSVSHSKKSKIDDDITFIASTSNFAEIASSSSPTAETVKQESPYYLKNFWFIVDTILGSEGQPPMARHVISREDLLLVEKLRSLSADCQKMFIRLFARQRKWIPRSKIDYDKEFSRSNFSNQILDQLVCSGLLLDVSGLVKLKHALELLSAPQAKTFATSMGIFPPSTAKSFANKGAMIAHVLGLQSSQNWSRNEARCLVKCRALIGKCYSIQKDAKEAFLRLFLLFSKICDLTKQEQSGTATLQTQLFSLLETALGTLKFPEVDVELSKIDGFFDKIYRSADEVSNALVFYSKSEKIEALNQAKKSPPVELALKVVTRYKETITECDDLAQLPKHMRRMALPHIAKRSLLVCAETFERARDYKQAVSVFRLILNTNKKFGESLRRKAWPRLILDLSYHLRDYQGALSEAIKALTDDDTLMPSTKLEIEERVVNELSKRVDIGHFCRQVVPDEGAHRKISAPIVSYEFEKSKTNFIRTSGDGSVQVVSVEAIASDFYLSQGIDGEQYSEALHSEGHDLRSLLGLLFWDVIYSDLGLDFPVFVTKYQPHPLDFYSGPEFYERRRQVIDERLDLIENDSEDLAKVCEIVGDVWSGHENEQATLVSWNCFTNLDQAFRLIRATGRTRLAFLMKTIISNLRFYRSGFPDLTLWDEKSRSLRFVEVKGPGDTLHPKQRIWLDILRKNGFAAEVCRVAGVKSRKL